MMLIANPERVYSTITTTHGFERPAWSSPVLPPGVGVVALLLCLNAASASAQPANSNPTGRRTLPDAVEDAQPPQPVAIRRPEQRKTDHDNSNEFAATNAAPSSPAFRSQPDQGEIRGFDFYRDPLNAKRPMQTAIEIMQADIAAKPGVMQAQRQLLESRYNLDPKLDPEAKMSRGKPLPVGPTARLRVAGWEELGKMNPAQIRQAGLFPYPSLPHPKQTSGGQVFPQMQIEMFPRLQRFDVDFDLPEAFLPEFPPAIFLQNRPELGDVSRGEVISINNYYRLLKDILTPVQLDGLRLLRRLCRRKNSTPPTIGKASMPAWEWPVSIATSMAIPPASSISIPTTGRNSAGCGSTRPACAASLTSRSIVPSAACARWKILPNLSSGRPISTVIPFMP
jgi:hypothetical protein